MTGTIGALLAVALLGIFVAMQQILSRVIYAEVALSQGLPPDSKVAVSISGAERTTIDRSGFDEARAGAVLPADAVVVLASATCTTCIRLIDGLGDPDVATELPLHVYFDADPPAVARDLGAKATVHDHAHEIIDGLATPALPYGVIMKDGAAVAHDPLPDLHRLTNLGLGVGVIVGAADPAEEIR